MKPKDQNLNCSIENPDYSEQDEVDSFFKECCSQNKLAEIKKLFRGKIKPSQISLGLQNACTKNHLKVVKYLTSEIKTTLKTDEIQECFVSACVEGSQDIIKYLCEESKYKIDLNYKENAAFKLACEFNRYETIYYLVFDRDIEETSDIKNYLKVREKDQISKLFSLRGLNKNLNSDLNTSNFKDRRLKV